MRIWSLNNYTRFNGFSDVENTYKLLLPLLVRWFAKCTLYWEQKHERHSKFKSLGIVGSPSRTSTKRSIADTNRTSSDGELNICCVIDRSDSFIQYSSA